MSKYIFIKNLSILDTIIFKEGDEIDINPDDKITTNGKFGNIEFTFEDLKNHIKEKIDEDMDVKIILLDDENEIKDYRIQLDIKTTRKKAKEIQNYLKENLKSLV
jgi:hypothetical protein